MIPAGAFDWWDQALEIAVRRVSLRGERQRVHSTDGGRTWAIGPTIPRCQQIGGQDGGVRG